MGEVESVIVATAADIRLSAEYIDGRWHVECLDTLDNVKETAVWDYKTVGAVLFLMAGVGEEEEVDQELTELMYKIAEPAIRNWKIRPIP